MVRGVKAISWSTLALCVCSHTCVHSLLLNSLTYLKSLLRDSIQLFLKLEKRK